MVMKLASIEILPDWQTMDANRGMTADVTVHENSATPTTNFKTRLSAEAADKIIAIVIAEVQASAAAMRDASIEYNAKGM